MCVLYLRDSSLVGYMSKHQYIGFDVGIRNLAYCIILKDGDLLAIKSLRKIDLGCKKQHIQRIIECVIDELDCIFTDEIVHDVPITVLIESQMTSVMRCIQTVINTFFKLNAKYIGIDITTKYVSAKIKLSLIDRYTSEYVRPTVVATSTYRQNKSDAVHFAKWLLLNKYCDQKMHDQLTKSKKPDDESDSFLMTAAYIENKNDALR